MPARVNSELARLRAKERLYDELVDQLARTERELAQLTADAAGGSDHAGVDRAWPEIANDLATALRPYTLLSQRRSRNDCDLAAWVVEDAVLDCVLGVA